MPSSLLLYAICTEMSSAFLTFRKFDKPRQMWYTKALRALPENGRRLASDFCSHCHCNRWEVIGMMDQFVTFGDLLELGGFLLSLATLILYIYYNHKNSNDNHHDKKKK